MNADDVVLDVDEAYAQLKNSSSTLTGHRGRKSGNSAAMFMQSNIDHKMIFLSSMSLSHAV